MAESLKKPLVTLFLFSLLLTSAALFFYPKEASAQTTCAGALASDIGLSFVSKIIAVPTSDALVQNYTGGDFVATCIVKPLIIAMAQRILANITNSLVTWIQSGFNGNPTFVTNIDDLVSNSANQAIGQFINSTALSFLCQPFSLQVRIALATSFIEQPYQGCTLSQIDNNIQQFGNTEQAWSSWLNISTVPANNQYGAYVELSSQLGSQLNAQSQEINNEVQRGLGFLDHTVCSGYVVDDVQNTDNENTEDGEQVVQVPASASTPGAYCPPANLKTSTPGADIANALFGAQNKTVDQLGVASDINQIMGALVNELITKTITGPGGLLGAKTQSVSNNADLSVTVSGESSSNTSIVNTLNSETSSAIDELNLNGTNLALTATVNASSVGVGSNPNNAIDGDVTTTFTSGNESSPSYTLDLGSPQTFSEIDIVSPYPMEATLGNVEVEVSNSSTFDESDPSTEVWDSISNTFVPVASASAGIFNATTSSVFTVSAPATAEYVKITKASDLATDNEGNCESGQTDSSGACTDPLQISEIEVIAQNTASTGSGTNGTGASTSGTISFTGNPSGSTESIARSTTGTYSLSVSSSGIVATPVSATITLTSINGISPSATFTTTGYSLSRTVNGQSVNIDPNASLLSTGTLNLTNLAVPVEFDLGLTANQNASIGASYNFIVTLTDANGIPLGTNTETFVIQ